MNYTYGQNGKWEVTKWASHKDIHISVKDEYDNYMFVANCGNPETDTLPHNRDAEANANLIVSAVNACIKLNPENPQAVAESIGDMYEALKHVNEMLEIVLPKINWVCMFGEKLHLLEKIPIEVKETLAKAKGKK